jgi:hypothetical protein
MKLINRAINHFADFGFYPEKTPLGGLSLLPVLGIYAAVALGMFLRRLSAFPAIDVRPENLRAGVFIGSIIIALVITPPLMQWISKRHQGRPSWEHVAWSLAYGFFLQPLLGKLVTEITKIAS